MNEENENDVRAALNCINDVDDYDTWLHVGMALKDGGYDLCLWDEWSRKGQKYSEGCCDKKWDTFENEGFHINTVFYLASQNGYACHSNSSEPIDDSTNVWETVLPDETPVINHDGESAVIEPDDAYFNQFQQMKEYLSAMFDSSEIVGYCSDIRSGVFNRTAGSLIDAIDKYAETKNIENVIGTYDRSKGVYIRVNPLDGKGEADKNVTVFRYTLIESDTMPVDRQNFLLKEFKLPIKALVFSGSKSVHAIVHIDAKDKAEYTERVRWLHDALQKWGFEADPQDKNPSRYSRLPGVYRNGHKQFLMGTDLGLSGFVEWKKYFESMEDGLPEPVPMNKVWNNMPPLAPELIEGVLRQGHKMILSATSKSGKSFALIELAFAISEGMNWFGHKCKQGKVLYINMEIDEASFMHRVKAVYDALGMNQGIHTDNFVEWTLRGYGRTLSKLVQPIIRRVKDNGYIAVIVDPLYKVMEGDENSNSDIAKLVSYFDKIARETGCAVIYAHHYAKGFMGDRSSIDRGAGAGTFSRDPDAIVTMSELDWSDPDDSDHKALQIDYTLREFHGIASQKLFWQYPLHRPDVNGALDDIGLITSSSQKQKQAEAVKENKSTKESELISRIISTIPKYQNGFLVSDFTKEYKKQANSKTGIPISTAKDMLKRYGYCQTGESIGNSKIWNIQE